MTTAEHVTGQLDLEGRPMAEDFTPEQAARLAVIEAAPDADVSLRWRVADALYRAQWELPPSEEQPLAEQPPAWQDLFLAQADAALAVLLEDARR